MNKLKTLLPLALFYWLLAMPGIANNAQLYTLELNATLEFIVRAADVGVAAASSELPSSHPWKIEEQLFFKEHGCNAVHIFSTYNSTREALEKAMPLVSQQSNRPFYYFFAIAGRPRGDDVAYKTVSGLDLPESDSLIAKEDNYLWAQTINATMVAAKQALLSGADSKTTAIVAIRAAFNFVLPFLPNIKKAISQAVTSDLIVQDVSLITLIEILDKPIDTDEFKSSIPELQVYYIEIIAGIKREMANHSQCPLRRFLGL